MEKDGTPFNLDTFREVIDINLVRLRSRRFLLWNAHDTSLPLSRRPAPSTSPDWSLPGSSSPTPPLKKGRPSKTTGASWSSRARRATRTARRVRSRTRPARPAWRGWSCRWRGTCPGTVRSSRIGPGHSVFRAQAGCAVWAGIRVLAIAPSLFSTNMGAGTSDSVKANLLKAVEHPPRFGDPEEFGAPFRRLSLRPQSDVERDTGRAASLAVECIKNSYLNGTGKSTASSPI